MSLSEAWELVAERDPEWDDLQRDRMAGLAIFEKGIHACGYHLSLTSDPANHFKVEQSECLLCANLARFDRVQGEADQRELRQIGGDSAPAGAPRSSDGRVTSVRPKPSPAVQALLDAQNSPPRA